jgi:transcription antitermination factor NusG
MSEKRWYALYTRVRWEKKVSELLSKRNIENYCPLNRVERQWADRKKLVDEPLFISYVFVKVKEADHLQLKKTAGVISVVHWLGKPAVIRENEIETIRYFLNEHQNITLERMSVNVNDRVRVIRGPLINQEGHVIAVKSKTLKIALPSMGFIMSAEVEINKTELLLSTTQTSSSKMASRLGLSM